MGSHHAVAMKVAMQASAAAATAAADVTVSLHAGAGSCQDDVDAAKLGVGSGGEASKEEVHY